jgi:hypothetical protein
LEDGYIVAVMIKVSGSRLTTVSSRLYKYLAHHSKSCAARADLLIFQEYCPKVVQTHNLTRTLKRASKIDNWAFVSQRLWIKTGFNLDTRTIDKILDHESSVLFEVLLELKHFLEENFAILVRFKRDNSGS